MTTATTFTEMARMSDSHDDHHQPSGAPMHQEIVENLPLGQVMFATVLGLIAAVAGIVTGIIFIND